jgi:hypothetical protein
MTAHNLVPLLNPSSCVEQGFVYFGTWHDGRIPAPYLLYKDAHYLVIQSGDCGRNDTPIQLVIPRSALTWLLNVVRYPFSRGDGYEACFERETLTVRRSATLNGEGVSGFLIRNISRPTGTKMQPAQQILITDDFMHEYLVPLMDGLNSGS